MKHRLRLIVVSQLLIASLVAAQQQRGSGRRSADGIEFPREIERRPVQVDLPVIGEALGRIPDRVSERIHSSEKSRAELDRRTKAKTRLEWFATGLHGSDVAMLRLTDGRVSLMSLIYSNMNDQRFNQITKEIEQFQARQVAQNYRASGGVPIACEIVRQGKTGAQLIAGITPNNWYVLTHNVKPDVADGLKTNKPVVGMTEQELAMVMGREPSSAQASSVGKDLVWEERRHIEIMGVDEEYDPLAGFLKPAVSGDKLTAQVRNGVVVRLQATGN